MSPEDVKRYVGQRVELEISPRSGMSSPVRGRLAGTVDAADGLVLFVQPEAGAPEERLSIHHHYVTGIRAS